MKLLEVRAILRRATKQDLFTGDVTDLKSKHGIRENVTVFYRDQNTKQIVGPYLLSQHTHFEPLCTAYIFGCVGVIKPHVNPKPTDFVFDLVLREASVSDIKDLPIFMKINKIFYIYSQQQLAGPFYIDNSTTSLYLENLIVKKQLFVPNERQHFRKKELKKTA